MNAPLLRVFFCFLLGGCAVVRMAHAQTLAITTSDVRFASNGGTVTVQVVLNYRGKSLSGLGLEIQLPPGWSHESTFGANQPHVGPQPGETDSLGWAYVEIPAEVAKFSFVLAYRAGLSGQQTLNARPVFRPAGEGASEAQKIVFAGP